MRSGERLLAAVVLVASDVLLAFLVWYVASILQDAFGRNALSTISVAGMIEPVALWVGARALLGLYPGYGLNNDQDFRRQIFATIAALITNLTVAYFCCPNSCSHYQSWQRHTSASCSWLRCFDTL
jgi:hypothetical protein